MSSSGEIFSLINSVDYFFDHILIHLNNAKILTRIPTDSPFFSLTEDTFYWRTFWSSIRMITIKWNNSKALQLNLMSKWPSPTTVRFLLVFTLHFCSGPLRFQAQILSKRYWTKAHVSRVSVQIKFNNRVPIFCIPLQEYVSLLGDYSSKKKLMLYHTRFQRKHPTSIERILNLLTVHPTHRMYYIPDNFNSTCST